jgi:hypothetical protein
MSNVRIIAITLLILLALAMPARATEEGPRKLDAVEGCGVALPAYFLNPGDVPAIFGAEAEHMVKLFAHSYAADIAKSCRDRPALREKVQARVAAICFAAAAGVDEPHPYIVGNWLIIEVHPDAYARVPFRRKLAAAIERGSVGMPGYDCRPEDL